MTSKDIKLVLLVFAGIMLAALCISVLSCIDQQIQEAQDFQQWLRSN